MSEMVLGLKLYYPAIKEVIRKRNEPTMYTISHAYMASLLLVIYLDTTLKAKAGNLEGTGVENCSKIQEE